MKPMMMLPAVTAKVSSSFGPSLMICRTSHLNSMSRIIAGSSAVRRVSPTASMSPPEWSKTPMVLSSAATM